MQVDGPPHFVDRDLLCAKCGYNLHALPRHGACPECGEAIEHSVHGDWLRYADRNWLVQLMRGLKIAGASHRLLVYVILAMLLLLTLAVIILPRGVDKAIEAVMDAVFIGLRWVIWVLPLGIGVGLWMIATPEPRLDAKQVHWAAAMRVLAALVVPVFYIWAVATESRFLWGMTNTAIELIVIHICFAIVWLHVYVARWQAHELNRRCAAAPPIPVVIHRTRWGMKLVAPIVILVVYWAGPLRAQQLGWFSVPPKSTQNMLFFITAIVWLTTIGKLVRTQPSVIAEINSKPQ